MQNMNAIVLEDGIIKEPHLIFYELISEVIRIRLSPSIVLHDIYSADIDLIHTIDFNLLKSTNPNLFKKLKSFSDEVNLSLKKSDFKYDKEHQFLDYLNNVSDIRLFRQAIFYEYSKMNIYEKSVFYLLSDRISSLFLPIAYLKSKINKEDLYFLIKLGIRNFDKLTEYDYNEYEKFSFNELEEFLLKSRIFLQVAQESIINNAIINGENKEREFKSTLRYDVRKKMINKALETECLKTIAAFLNTKGGELYIGVEDDGTIYGIEKDGFNNNDKYLLHIDNLINNRLKPNVSSLIDATVETVNGKNICKVRCGRSQKPVYVQSNGQEDFYIRTGPNSRKLKMSDMMDYVKTNFPDF